MSLTKYFLMQGSLQEVPDDNIKTLCFMLGLKPPRFKEAKVGTKSRLIPVFAMERFCFSEYFSIGDC